MRLSLTYCCISISHFSTVYNAPYCLSSSFCRSEKKEQPKKKSKKDKKDEKKEEKVTATVVHVY